jgi:HEAT repeat protein
MDDGEVRRWAEALQSDDARLRSDAISALAQATDAGADLSPAVSALADALTDEVGEIRAQAAYTLVSISEHGGDIVSALPALSRALADEEEDVRREAVWALYCLSYAGKDVTAAASELERAIRDSSESVRGNGAIALTLHYLNRGAEAKAAELLDGEAGAVQFGAAWGYTDHDRRTRNKAALQALIKRIRPGLLDVAIRDGIVGSIHWARERGEDISFELGAVDELLAQAKDEVEQAPLYGILMKLKSAKT